MTVTAVRLAGQPGKPLLVLGPSLGTSVRTLWSSVATDLADEFDVIGWDLPGHGANRSVPPERLEMADLARDVIEMVDGLDGTPAVFHYAGDSVGGAVGLQLLADHPHRVATAVLLCTGVVIGSADGWRERQETVRRSGTAALTDSAPQRWFGPGFAQRAPEVAGRLVDELVDVADDGYIAVCQALAAFDIRARLADIDAPVLAVAGAEDAVTPPSGLEAIATGVRRGRLVVLPGVAHLAPAEAPHEVAALIRDHAAAAVADERTVAEVRAAGMAVRREVLGAAHVDRATAATTDFTREFQEFITEYAWGGIWTRPGLDRRSRSLITLTAMVARGHHEELAMHVRAARTNGVSVAEIKELLLQTAIYCGVPDANTAFRIAQGVLRELGDA
jgi:3-oxoadipate enol-lactonase / 4-carboxymuconolactone decarboxylase